MTNPFEALNIEDDEEETTYVKAEDKHKRTQQQKKQYKKQQEVQIAPKKETPTNDDAILPEHLKENNTVGRRMREQRPPKDIGTGHYHDRRSGTGRVDRPRKEGGGYGNVGNAKDQVREDKYIKPVVEGEQPAEGEVQVEEKKPEEPQAVTLDQYYKTKGIELTYNIEKKAPAKKGDINAEWIKKEKLTLLQTKEDKKLEEASLQNKKKGKKVEKEEEEEKTEIQVGFGSKAVSSRREDHRERNEKGGKKGKVNLDDDFPAL